MGFGFRVLRADCHIWGGKKNFKIKNCIRLFFPSPSHCVWALFNYRILGVGYEETMRTLLNAISSRGKSNRRGDKPVPSPENTDALPITRISLQPREPQFKNTPHSARAAAELSQAETVFLLINRRTDLPVPSSCFTQRFN